MTDIMRPVLPPGLAAFIRGQIAMAVAEEREACAKQAERIVGDYGNAAGEHIAKYIRARSALKNGSDG